MKPQEKIIDNQPKFLAYTQNIDIFETIKAYCPKGAIVLVFPEGDMWSFRRELKLLAKKFPGENRLVCIFPHQYKPSTVFFAKSWVERNKKFFTALYDLILSYDGKVQLNKTDFEEFIKI